MDKNFGERKDSVWFILESRFNIIDDDEASSIISPLYLTQLPPATFDYHRPTDRPFSFQNCKLNPLFLPELFFIKFFRELLALYSEMQQGFNLSLWKCQWAYNYNITRNIALGCVWTCTKIWLTGGCLISWI